MKDKITTKLADKATIYHSGVGAIQTIDDISIKAMAEQFMKDSKEAGFAGLSVGLDHLNDLTPEQREAVVENQIPLTTEAVGWIDSVEARPDGLWGTITNFTEEGAKAIEQGIYKFLSPVFNLNDAEMLEPSKEGVPAFRPLRLNSAAFTNSPRLGWSMRVSLNASNSDKKQIISGVSIALNGETIEKVEEKGTIKEGVMNMADDKLVEKAGCAEGDAVPQEDIAKLLELSKAEVEVLKAKVAELQAQIDGEAQKKLDEEMEAEGEAVANSYGIKDTPAFVALYKKDKEYAISMIKLVGVVEKKEKKEVKGEKVIDKSLNSLPTFGVEEKKEVKVDKVAEYMKSHPGVSRAVAMSRLV